MTDENMPHLIAALAEIMGEVGTVKKAGTNKFHDYKYATAADVMHKLQPLMAKHGIVVFQNERDQHLIANETVMAIAYEFTIAHKSGAVWPQVPVHTGIAVAKNSKGGFDDKTANKCHTAARKYFLLSLFQIPTGDYADADADDDTPPPPVPPRDDDPLAADDDFPGDAFAEANEAMLESYTASFKHEVAKMTNIVTLRSLWADHEASRKGLDIRPGSNLQTKLHAYWSNRGRELAAAQNAKG